MAPTDARAIGVTSKSPRTDWAELHGWYQAILTAGQNWRTRLSRRLKDLGLKGLLTPESVAIIEADVVESRNHLRRTLLKASECLLRRPGRPLQTAGDCRFLLLLSANPLLHSVWYDDHEPKDELSASRNTAQRKQAEGTDEVKLPLKVARSTARRHTGIVKRILGLIANLSQEIHRNLVSCFARYADDDFRKFVELVGGFVTHRLMRQRRSHRGSQPHTMTSVLVPEISGPGAGTSAQLHAALGIGTKTASPANLEGVVDYRDDWQIKVAAKVMSLLFIANHSNGLKAQEYTTAHAAKVGHSSSDPHDPLSQTSRVFGFRSRERVQLLPTSAFYNTLLDYCDLIGDFEAWENRSGSFSFCQYPMFLSIWAKIRILEHDARRQMEIKARQAFFNSILSRRAVSQYLVLRVRRECLVDDSLRGVSEVVGSGEEDIKKGLRIAFVGEEGVDAGG